MQISRLIRATFLFLAAFSIAACGSVKKSAKNDVNSYMPPSFEGNSATEIMPEKEKNTDVWDMSDVDISHIGKGRKLIAFTFDDAPSKCTENIFAVFAAFNEAYPAYSASATLFVNGLRANPSSLPHLHAAYALGFELGNHTQRHLDLTKLPQEKLIQEIDETDAILSRIDGKERHLLRAPYGAVNELVRAQSFTPIIDWTIDTRDWMGISPEKIYQTVFENRFSGAIVLMHDGYENTVEALKLLLPDLMKDGYQVVGVSQLAKAHNCILKNGSVYIRARKQ